VPSAARVHVRIEKRGIAGAEVVRRVNAMMRALQLKKEEVSIVLTGDDQIHDLNRIYRHKDRPTDVLAFAQREGELADGSDPLLGDVIVSIDTARRQARAANRPLLDEVTMLLAHGLLHLLGWDHDTDAKDRRMRKETDRLCQAASRAGRPSRGLTPSKARARGALTTFRTARKPVRTAT
jgi:probable rRNA maturation factor